MTTQEAKIEAYEEMKAYLGDCKCHRPLMNFIDKQIELNKQTDEHL